MIYVDELVHHQSSDSGVVEKYGHEWCHMFSDNLAKLRSFATKIGMRDSWLQGWPDHRRPHYDLRPSFRKRAVSAGAFQLDYDNEDHVKLLKCNMLLWKMRWHAREDQSLLRRVVGSIYLTYSDIEIDKKSAIEIRKYFDTQFMNDIGSLDGPMKARVIELESLLRFASEYHKNREADHIRSDIKIKL